MTRQRALIKNKAVTYGVCLAIATILWFLNALNKEYITDITYPVKYNDLPKGKMLVSDVPREIKLEVKAHGFALLRHELTTSFLPIVFHVHGDVLQGRDVLERNVGADEIKARISAQFNSDIQLLHVTPESILFKFSLLKSKKVPVVTDVRYTLRQQHVLKKELTITPDSVTVEGPAAVVDTLRAVRAKPVTLDNLAKSVSRDLDLVEVPGIRPSVDEVRLAIEVEQSTEAKKSIPLLVRDLPAHLNLRLFPPVVEVTYNVGLSRYDRVLDSHFVLSVDYRQVTGAPNALAVKVEKCPPFIENLTLSPGQVEYLIERK
ncbi:MAG: YbbR-like domain-containing protein [Odoribacteraceae bacterium]|nr:YbbR-like domain-containing protein [Odoribacteraceae bacterium]